MATIQRLENSRLEAVIDRERGCFDLRDKGSGVRWDRDPFEQSPGELTLARQGGGMLAIDLGRAGAITVRKSDESTVNIEFADFSSYAPELADARVSTRLSLQDAELSVEVLEVIYPAETFRFENIVYPQRAFALSTFGDDGYLALPTWQGSLVPTHNFNKIPSGPFWAYDDFSYSKAACPDLPIWGWGGLSMAWFGAVKGNGAFAAIIHTTDDAGVRCILNYNLQHLFDPKQSTSPYSKIAAVSPLWRSVKGSFGYSRKVVYRFMPGGTYVDMAKHYRGHLEETGRFRTLQQKREDNPNLEKLFGALMINLDGGYPWYVGKKAWQYTWNDVKRMVTELHDEDGIERCLLINWGGYSKYPPEFYPFDERFGTDAELQEAVDAAHERDFLFAFYNGYAAALDHAPNWDPSLVRINRDQSFSAWRWGRVCSQHYLRFAEDNLPKAAGQIGQIADYTDMMTAHELVECYSEEHPHTRTEDKENRIGIFRYIKSLNLLTGSECANDWATPYLDYSKGGSYAYGGGGIPAVCKLVRVPLFNLVHHDAQIIYAYDEAHGGAGEILENLAFGHHPLFGTNMVKFEGDRKSLKAVMTKERQRYLREIAQAELTEHEFLSESYDVQRTKFSTGHEVFVNPTPYDVRLESGETVEQKGFLIHFPDGTVYRGSIGRQVNM